MPTIEWYGASGRRYAFHAYELPQTFPKGHGGTYIYCHWASGRWHPICIGHGEFAACIGDRHPEAEDLLARGATHVHLRPNADLSSREREHRDLVAAQPRRGQTQETEVLGPGEMPLVDRDERAPG